MTEPTELIPDEDLDGSTFDDRWIAFAIWGAALLALLVTSYAGIVGPMSNIDLSMLSLDRLSVLSDPETKGPNNDLIAWMALIITAAVALGTMFLWALFGRATSALLAALSDEPTYGVPAHVWVGGDGRRSMLGDLLMWAGLVWALLILRPVLIAALRLLTV